MGGILQTRWHSVHMISREMRNQRELLRRSGDLVWDSHRSTLLTSPYIPRSWQPRRWASVPLAYSRDSVYVWPNCGGQTDPMTTASPGFGKKPPSQQSTSQGKPKRHCHHGYASQIMLVFPHSNREESAAGETTAHAVTIS